MGNSRIAYQIRSKDWLNFYGFSLFVCDSHGVHFLFILWIERVLHCSWLCGGSWFCIIRVLGSSCCGRWSAKTPSSFFFRSSWWDRNWSHRILNTRCGILITCTLFLLLVFLPCQETSKPFAWLPHLCQFRLRCHFITRARTYKKATNEIQISLVSPVYLSFIAFNTIMVRLFSTGFNYTLLLTAQLLLFYYFSLAVNTIFRGRVLWLIK